MEQELQLQSAQTTFPAKARRFLHRLMWPWARRVRVRSAGFEYIHYRALQVEGEPFPLKAELRALAKLAREREIPRLLLDFQMSPLPVERGVFSAILACPELAERGRWTIAVLMKSDAPVLSMEMAKHITHLITGMGQSARVFSDARTAVEWLEGGA